MGKRQLNDEKNDRKMRVLTFSMGSLFRIVIIGMILGVGFVGFRFFMKNRVRAERKGRPERGLYVQVKPVELSKHTVMVQAMGTVLPSRELALSPEVGGRIKLVSPDLEPGARLTAGTVVAEIDRSDLELTLKRSQAELERVKASLTLELGKQEVARREFEMLDENVSLEEKRLMLRQPQLEQARAAVDTATANVEQAELNLKRTQIRVPFDCTVVSENVETGSEVTPNSVIARLVGTETYWIDASVPMDYLHWINVPEANARDGSQVEVYHEPSWGENVFRKGRVIRLRPRVETNGRMAKVLVSVTDPLEIEAEVGKSHPLVLDTYVRVEIKGERIRDVVALKREWVHDGDQVWLMDEAGKLQFRSVEIAWRTRDQLFVDARLQEGEKIVITDIAAPVEGMALTIQLPEKKGETGQGSDMDGGAERVPEQLKDKSNDNAESGTREMKREKGDKREGSSGAGKGRQQKGVHQ